MKNLMSKTNRQKIVCINPCCYLCFCLVNDIGSNQNNNKKQKVAISLWILGIIENYDFIVHESKLGLNIVVNCRIMNFHHICVAVALNGNYLTQCNEYQIIYHFVFFFLLQNNVFFGSLKWRWVICLYNTCWKCNITNWSLIFDQFIQL